MDANANLARQRQILAEMREISEEIERTEEDGRSTTDLVDDRVDLLYELSALAEEMDEALTKGSALPDAWAAGRS